MARLVVISPGLAGLSYGLGKQWVTIGRSSSNAFQIVESSISGQHCEVQLRGSELVVRDMRSTNGTFVRGVIVSEAVLKPWEILRLGDVELRFEFNVPTAAKGNSAAPVSDPASAKDDGAPVVKKNHVLLVDDSMAFLETIAELFDTMADKAWKIYQASAADRALDILSKHPIDLAVFDISMPMLDGVQLLGMAHRRYPDVKKVILTGNASESRRAECLANGAELFLEKPTTPEGFKFVFNVLKDLLVWHQREGFSGTLRHVGLTDVIQIQCLGRHSCVLSIQNSKAQGEIYIESGVIIHATTGTSSGEEALFQLLALNQGEFNLKAFESPAERTLQGSWEFLLMESARKRDEEKNARVAEDTVLMTKPPVPASAAPSAATPESTVSDKTATPEQPVPPSDPAAGPGDEFIIVQTYDGKWHPTDEGKKP